MADNRIDPVSAAVSPTGTPLVPVKYVPFISAALALAGVVVQFVPAHTIAHKIALGLISFGGLFGVVSPGLRR